MNKGILELKSAHQGSSKNRVEIEKSKICGCFYCLKTFPPEEIKEWILENDKKETAQCPYCSVDSVIGSASGFPIEPNFLEKMKNYWFG